MAKQNTAKETVFSRDGSLEERSADLFGASIQELLARLSLWRLPKSPFVPRPAFQALTFFVFKARNEVIEAERDGGPSTTCGSKIARACGRADTKHQALRPYVKCL
jgi:hypothetical protein